MRRLDLAFTALQVPTDFLALIIAAITAFVLRFSQAFLEYRPIIQTITPQQYAISTGIVIAAWMFCFWLTGLYSTKVRPAWQELGRIIVGSTAGMMIVIAMVFFQREVTASRFLILAVWGLAIVYVWIGRLILRFVRHQLLRRGIGHQRIAVIGSSNAAATLKTWYLQKPANGYTVVKSYKVWSDDAREEMTKLRREERLDGILLAEPRVSKEEALDLIAFAEEQHLSFRYLADLFAARFTRINVTTEGGIPLIETLPTPLDGWGRIAKRIFDIAVALVILLFVSPILIISAIVILIQDGSPVFFHNERVGERGKLFPTYKIRSMWKKFCIGPQFSKKANEQNLSLEKDLIKEKSIKEGPIYKIEGDPRITPFGHWLRRWSIDELPQFFNVLDGSMSIVGPRPHQPREVEGYTPEHRKVLAVKPGITGMAQVSGRSDLSAEDEARLDIWYIEHWSLWLDLIVILKTPLVVLLRRGVY